MGFYRLLLAFCVLYSHVFGAIGGWNPGVVAVISFFVMSGYVMALLIAKHYPRPNDIGRFLVDRAARLYPQFLFYLALTLVLASVLPLSDAFLQNRQPHAVVLNALMLPLGFYMFGLENALYVPPAWSLGLELTFYLIFPFFLLASRSIRALVVSVSVLIFIVAVLGCINTDWFGYRLLPGTFFIFVAGACLARPAVLAGWLPATVLAGSVVAAMAVLASPALSGAAYNKEVLTGIAIGVSVVWLLRSVRFSRIDELLGSLSYGVFLNHFLMMWLVDYAQMTRMLVPAFSLLAALASYKLVEEPALAARQKLRHLRTRPAASGI
jgi:peptidoglycan/LPS O-acetylase OafA/YrhL